MENTYYITYDLPIPYKDLMFYPITVKDYFFFTAYSQCLLLEKNSIPDPNIIRLTDLGYIYYLTQSEKSSDANLLFFDRLLALCLKDEDSFKKPEESIMRYRYDDKGTPFFVVNDKPYYNRDFLKIKEIISAQNMLELPDENISKEVRDSLEKAEEYKAKMNGTKSGSFEDYMISLSVITGWTLDYINGMTIRKFVKSVRRLDNYVHYKIYLAASMSGMVEFKDKSFIKHWLSEIDKSNKYEDVSLDLEKVQGTLSLDNTKKQYS